MPKYLLCLTIALCVGCQTENLDPIVEVADDDPLMDAAFQQAKENLPLFEQHLAKPDAFCAVKIGFASGDTTEYCWVSNVEITDSGYRGRLDSIPHGDLGFQTGDAIDFNQDRIVDWLVQQPGQKTLGNYTLRAMFPKMSADDVNEAKAAMGWDD